MRILMIAFFLLFIQNISLAQDSTAYFQSSAKFIKHFTNAEYGQSIELFDDKLQAVLSNSELKNMWGDFEGRFGVYIDTGASFIRKSKEFYIVYTTMNFEKLSIYLKITFRKHGKIAGIYVEPLPVKGSYIKPSYASYVRIKEYRTSLNNGAFEMPAVLTLPKTPGPFPVVILVHGSGPQDMDETIGPNKPFKDLALGLASQGIAVFRYDKRTKLNIPASNQSEMTLQEEVTDDALKAIDFVKTFAEIDSNAIFVLGHSLGGMMAPEIAKQSGALKGIVLLAAPARSMLSLIDIQLNALMSAHQKANDTANVSHFEQLLKKVALANSDELSLATPADQLPYNISAPYWNSTKSYEQLSVAAELKIPFYVLHAGKDQQVFAKDFELWQRTLKHKKGMKFKRYAELNHLFFVSKSDNMNEDYFLQGNVSEEVVTDIATWVQSNSAAVDNNSN